MADLNYEESRLLDVVNDKDEVMEIKPRSEIHRLGLLHRQVHVWMFDEDKNIFFQKRGLHRLEARLLDATVGGHVNQGEDYLEAATRETKEEAGIDVSKEDLVFLKKIKNMSGTLEENLFNVNNFFQSVFIYKHPIKEELLIKEEGVPGVGFQKLSYEFLLNPDKEYTPLFIKYILEEELPLVLNYLK